MRKIETNEAAVLMEVEELVRAKVLTPVKVAQPSSPSRGDGREIARRMAAFLRTDGPAVLPDIARAVRVRHETARAILEGDPHFLRLPAPVGRSPRGRWWGVASPLVPEPGTTRDDNRGPGP